MLELKYFVLKPRSKQRGDAHALASRVAMLAYADMIFNTEMANQLIDWASREEARATKEFGP